MGNEPDPDDIANHNWRRPTSETESAAAIRRAATDQAYSAGQLFCDVLDQEDSTLEAFAAIVTPESWDSWEDFSGVREWFKHLNDVGYGSFADRAAGDDDVAYFKILADVHESYQVVETQIIDAAGIITLVWRPDLPSVLPDVIGHWRVHALGDYVHPDDVPRRR